MVVNDAVVGIWVGDDAAVVGVTDLAPVVDVPPQLLLQRVHLGPVGNAMIYLVCPLILNQPIWVSKKMERLQEVNSHGQNIFPRIFPKIFPKNLHIKKLQ